jgi:hypothetical protein
MTEIAIFPVQKSRQTITFFICKRTMMRGSKDTGGRRGRASWVSPNTGTPDKEVIQ